MKIARLLDVASASLKPWRARHPPTQHAAPLGLACAVLLYALFSGATREVDLIGLSASSRPSWLESGVEHALRAVQASMVELPLEIEAAAVAQLTNATHILSMENRRLSTQVRALQEGYAELRHGHEAAFAELQKRVHRTQSEVSWLSSQHEELKDHLKTALGGRHLALVSPDFSHDKPLEGRELSGSSKQLGWHVVAMTADAAGTVGSDAYSEAAPSPLTATDESAVSLVGPIAFQIARGLQNAQEEAMLSGQESVFTVDLDRRLFKVSSAGDPVVLDSSVNLSLFTARSERTGPASGHIRFFADGSSTGGRIDLELYGSRATVRVDWSTGLVTVEA